MFHTEMVKMITLRTHVPLGQEETNKLLVTSALLLVTSALLVVTSALLVGTRSY